MNTDSKIDIERLVATTDRFENVYDETVAQIEATWGFDRVNLMLYRQNENCLEAVAGTGHPHQRSHTFRIPLHDPHGEDFRSIAARSFLTGEPKVIYSREDLAYSSREKFPHKKFSRAFAVIPLVNEDRKLGILSVAVEEDSDREIDDSSITSLAPACREISELLWNQYYRFDNDSRNDEFLQTIIRDGLIDIHYQPILNITNGTRHGYEALTRSRHHILKSSSILFEFAQRYNRHRDLAYFTHRKSLTALDRIPEPTKLFLNFHPQDFKEYVLMEHANPFREIDLSRIVFEVTERAFYSAENEFLELLDRYRDRGVQIAIDDLGSGYSSLELLATLAPEYVKFDISIVKSIHTNKRKRELLRSLTEYAQRISCRAIAEGIESEGELTELHNIGCELAQGYYLGRPAPIESGAGG